jgi:hypothetical protein
VNVRAALAALLGLSAYTQAPANAGPSLGDEQVETIRKAMGGQIAPLPTTNFRWYLADIETAQRMADSGDLSRSAQLMRSCRGDGVIAGVSSTRTEGLVRLPKRFRGDAEMVSALELGGESVHSVFDAMCPPSELAAMAWDGITLGVGIGELVPVEGRDYKILIRLDPEFLVYRWAENRWYYRSIAGLLPITPGDGRWVLHIPGGRLYPWNGGIWRALAASYIRKTHAALHKDNWEAKLANPARVAVAPQGASETQKESWFRRVMAWGINTVFGLTPGYDVKLLESNGRGHEAWEKTVERCDREAIIALAGQVVTTDGGAGFSNSDIHRSIRADLIQSTAAQLAHTINTQVIPAWVIERWDEDALAGSPCVAWDVTPPKDLATEANSLLAVANAIKGLTEALAQHGSKLDVATVCSRFGVPILGDADGDGQSDTAAKDPELQSVTVQLISEVAAHTAHSSFMLMQGSTPNVAWDEDSHPRRDDGKFGSGGGQGGDGDRKKEGSGSSKSQEKPRRLDDKAHAESTKDLTSGRIKKTTDLGGGVNTSQLVEFKGGRKGVWKPKEGETTLTGIEPGSMYRREAATYEVDRALGIGLTPPTVVRTVDGKEGSVQEFVKAVQIHKISDADRKELADRDGTRLTMFDAITGNCDRHEGNLMVREVDGQKQYIAIDNGLAMPAGKPFRFNHFGGELREDPDEIRKFIDFSAHKDHLQDIKMTDVAKSLADRGIDREAAEGVLGRLAGLKEDPKALLKAMEKGGSDPWDAHESMLDWMGGGWRDTISKAKSDGLSRLLDRHWKKS